MQPFFFLFLYVIINNKRKEGGQKLLNLYECTIKYRVGTYNSNIHSKILYIEADCGLTAYTYCKAISVGWGNGTVYHPEVTRVIPPKPDVSLTLDDVTKKYGTVLVKESIEESKFKSFHYDDKSLGIKYGEDYK